MEDNIISKNIFAPAEGKVFPERKYASPAEERVSRDEFARSKSVIIENLTSYRRELPDGTVEEAWEYDPDTDEMANVTDRVRKEESKKKPAPAGGWKGQKFSL